MCPSTDPFALEGLQEEHVVSGSCVLRTDAVEMTAVKEIAEERAGIRRRTGDLMLEVAEESLVEGGCVGFGSGSHGSFYGSGDLDEVSWKDSGVRGVGGYEVERDLRGKVVQVVGRCGLRGEELGVWRISRNGESTILGYGRSREENMERSQFIKPCRIFFHVFFP
jgi:hypothetical protein